MIHRGTKGIFIVIFSVLASMCGGFFLERMVDLTYQLTEPSLFLGSCLAFVQAELFNLPLVDLGRGLSLGVSLYFLCE
jgi:hypothetical protein